MRTPRPGTIGVVLVLMLSPAVVGAQVDASERPSSVSTLSTGSVTLTTEPETVVLWDGQQIGTTDAAGRMTISNIPFGDYSLTLRNEGFEEVVEALSITGDQTLEVALARPPASATAEPGDPPVLESSLPDPFAEQSTPLTSVMVVAFLVAVAGGALWLGHRRRRFEPEDVVPPEPEGPRVVMAHGGKGRRRSPGFYEDLRQRETVLEGLEERGPDRPRPKIIDLPVVDHRSMEEEG